MIIFLDFDGVLHPFPVPKDPAHLFENLSRLEQVLRDYPHTRIVISSTWREEHSFVELVALFSPDIRNRIIDVLPVFEIHSLADMEAIRFREIRNYLNGREDNWIALDDDPDLFPKNCANLIHCIDGFGDEEEKQLRNALEVMKEI